MAVYLVLVHLLHGLEMQILPDNLQEDGIILRVKTGAPESGSTWRWEWSPDIYGEQEVLLKGIRTSGIEVFLP